MANWEKVKNPACIGTILNPGKLVNLRKG